MLADRQKVLTRLGSGLIPAPKRGSLVPLPLFNFYEAIPCEGPMNKVIAVSDSALISSLDLLEIINMARKEASEPEVRRNQFTERCADELEGEHYKSFVVTNPNGTTSEALMLTHDQCFLVGMRESKSVRRRVLEKLKDLENPSVQLPDFTNPAIAARAWADQVEKVQALAMETQEKQKALDVAQPKAEALDRISGAEGSICITSAAKILNIQPKKLFQSLHACGWIYKRPGARAWLGHQDKIRQGLLDHKSTTVERSDGSSKMVEQVLVTPKGLTKLAALMAAE